MTVDARPLAQLPWPGFRAQQIMEYAQDVRPSSSPRKPQSEGLMVRKRSTLTKWSLALLWVIVYGLFFWFSQEWY